MSKEGIEAHNKELKNEEEEEQLFPRQVEPDPDEEEENDTLKHPQQPQKNDKDGITEKI